MWVTGVGWASCALSGRLCGWPSEVWAWQDAVARQLTVDPDPVPNQFGL